MAIAANTVQNEQNGSHSKSISELHVTLLGEKRWFRIKSHALYKFKMVERRQRFRPLSLSLDLSRFFHTSPAARAGWPALEKCWSWNYPKGLALLGQCL
jgi:hypothetical protein